MLVVDETLNVVLDENYNEGVWPYGNTDNISVPQINPYFESEFADEDVKEELMKEEFQDDN